MLCCNPIPAGIFRPIQIQHTFFVVMLHQLSGRNIPSNTNTIQSYCCCVASTFRPEYSVQYKYNTELLLLCCINFPAGIFRPIQIQYTFFVVVLHQLSGRNIPSNTNTIHSYCCCVVIPFRPEYSVQYKYNTHSSLLCCINFPAGIFRPIQIQYRVIVVVLHQLSGRNIPSNTNTIHILRCCVASTFRPEYSVQYKYNTQLLLLCCNPIPAGIFRPIQIQYTFFVVVLHQLSGRNIPSNTNTIHSYCCCVVIPFRPEYSVQYKYNTHSSLLCCINFPAGIFSPIRIQYTVIVVVL